MSDSISIRRRQRPSVTSSNISGFSIPTSNHTSFNRSRRSSWSDSKKVWNASDETENYSDSRTLILKKLDGYYRKVKRQILAFQSLTTGLFPNHLESNKNIAHVVENVFCAIAVWALRQCYCKIDNDQGRSHELGQAAVKCMRGILNCWMKQAKKVEIFKSEQSTYDALHSKFNVFDGSEVEDADEVGQLQICAISIYLLTLVQMITSNLLIIFSMDEVDFVQQLVFSIERAYRTPDYGIWERGSKYNTNTCELHASSIGMAKAALEAMNGFNLYGDQGANWSVVYVDADAHNRNRTTFDTLLPRESASKNTDAALLLTVGWPTFAIHNETLVGSTVRKCIRKLRGTHGFKRFLRDGQYTDLESRDERFYKEPEIKKFDKNECEWPMFFAVMDASRYQYSPNAYKLMPHQLVDKNKPINRSILSNITFSDLVIHVVPISESVRLQQVLATYGIQTQTPKQIEPILILPPAELVKLYGHLGANEKFGFSGRPMRPIGVLGTCKVYQIASKTIICYPLTFETTDFYMSSDMNLLLDNIRSDLEFITRCWRLKGRPIYLIMLREQHLRGPQKSDLLELLTQIRVGKLSSTICVRLERLQTAISSACIEHLDFLNNTTCSTIDWKSVAVTEYRNVHEIGHYKSLTDITKTVIVNDDIDYINHEFKDQHEIDLRDFICNTDVAIGSLKKHTLATYELYRRGGLDWMIRENYRVKNHLQFLMKEASTCQNWAVIRFVSSLLHKMVDSLAPSVTNLLVRGKIVTIGIFGYEESVVDKPMRPNEIFKILYSDKVFGHSIFHAVLLQELLLNISVFMNTFPQLFNGILKIRLGWVLEAMKLGLEFFRADADETVTLNTISPNDIKQLLYYVLTTNVQQSTLQGADIEPRSSLQKRQMDGALSRVPTNFYEHVWSILERTPKGIKLCNILLPQQPTLSDMTDYELNFSLKIEEMLSRVFDPAYRCLVVEMFEAINVLLQRNPELCFIQPLDVDYLINEAVKLFQQQNNSVDPYKDFYNLPISLVGGSTGYMIRVIINYLFNVHIQKSDFADINAGVNINICKIS
ncbi:unnamed protein product [Rotaria sordida]|uniref:Phosphorylase b kinase regulatory subunit n=1 Tax=Rotaria sordida TaxID=392033 RepID=A0A814TL21_9BILA|nr:unnamed protein product [Rotaria sordida]